MKLPSAHAILLIIAAFVAVSTFFVPAGTYDKLTYDASDDVFVRMGFSDKSVLPATQASLDELNVRIPLENFTSGDIYRPIGIPGTYQVVDSQPQGFVAFVQSPIKGIIAAADIIFLVLIIGGLIGVMNLTGAFDAGISWLAGALQGREYLLIIFTTTLCAIGGTTFGLGEETLAFFPILIPVFIAARYDAMVGLASVFLGSSIGVMCSTINPFSTIIASDSAGILWTTGLHGRITMLVVCVTIAIIYILYYAQKVKKDPTKSVIYAQLDQHRAHFIGTTGKEIPKLNARLISILTVFTFTFIVMIVGVSSLGWWFTEMTATFLVGAIVIGFIARVNEAEFLSAFTKGAGELLGVAFIIGIARGISILMSDGLISDTMLHSAGEFTEGMSKGLFINTLFFIYNGLAFLIPSTSGMAVLTMPIISPLADSVGIGREIIVNVYQYGMGLFFIVSPTGLLLPSLVLVKIGYDRFLKFVWPLLLVLALVSMISLTISVY
jgi:uncharacterized ion transporter superfamily protein YfcC